MLLLLAACGGIATVDLFFSTAPPRQDGSTNVAVRITEGTGSSQMVLEERIEPFDMSFDLASIRLPFGGNRTLVAAIETDETPPRVLFTGRTLPFRLEESDSPVLTVIMTPMPDPGMARVVGESNGRIATSTITLSINLGSALGAVVSESPFFPPDRTERFNPGDMRLMPSPTMPGAVTVMFVIDGRCSDRAGCPRTIYFKSLDAFALESAVYSLSLIYDPFPPRLIDAAVRIDRGAVLGSDGSAEVTTEFDEPVALSTFASLSGGSPQCLAQVEVVGGRLDGLDFPDGCAGTYTIELTATDLAGNSIRLFEAATLVVDRSPPAPIDLAAVTSTCAAQDAIIVGGAGAADPRAVVDAAGERARADGEGGFIVRAEPGSVSILQVDAAGNESAARAVEVSSCGG